MPESRLPAGVAVFERGWLSSNNVLLIGEGPTALVDSGYWTHAAQTCALMRNALAGRELDLLLNTHLHSDHCGGNALLQESFVGLETLVPPGQARHVRQWDPVALTYQPTGQHCPRFRLDGLLIPGTELRLGNAVWQVHAAPGHDPHSVVLFEPETRTLISADALWEDGFGIVFPELAGEAGFDEVAGTLDLIERLGVEVVIPGHGAVFGDVPSALVRARRRLERLVADPARHAAHAVKVLLKFKLLELQQVLTADFMKWATAVPYIEQVRRRWFADAEANSWVQQMLMQLERSGAARQQAGWITNG